MTIRRIDPDEAVTINGVPVTAWQLAEARQELSHRGVHNPRWSELSEHDQETAALSAGGWLRALAELVAGETSTSDAVGRIQSYCGRIDRPHAGHVWTSESGRWCPGDEVPGRPEPRFPVTRPNATPGGGS